MKEISSNTPAYFIHKLVGVKFRRSATGLCDFIDVGDEFHLYFHGDTLETFGLAVMAYVEAQKAGKAAAEKLTDAEARDYIDKHTHTQDAEDWDAEKADAEAL